MSFLENVWQHIILFWIPRYTEEYADRFERLHGSPPHKAKGIWSGWAPKPSKPISIRELRHLLAQDEAKELQEIAARDQADTQIG